MWLLIHAGIKLTHVNKGVQGLVLPNNKILWGLITAELTHWSQETRICVSKLTIIDSNNGLSVGRCQAIIWTNAGILFIEILGTNFSEILSKIGTKMHLEILSAKYRPFCLSLNVLMILYCREIRHGKQCWQDACQIDEWAFVNKIAAWRTRAITTPNGIWMHGKCFFYFYRGVTRGSRRINSMATGLFCLKTYLNQLHRNHLSSA